MTFEVSKLQNGWLIRNNNGLHYRHDNPNAGVYIQDEKDIGATLAKMYEEAVDGANRERQQHEKERVLYQNAAIIGRPLGSL